MFQNEKITQNYGSHSENCHEGNSCLHSNIKRCQFRTFRVGLPQTHFIPLKTQQCCLSPREYQHLGGTDLNLGSGACQHVIALKVKKYNCPSFVNCHKCSGSLNDFIAVQQVPSWQSASHYSIVRNHSDSYFLAILLT